MEDKIKLSLSVDNESALTCNEFSENCMQRTFVPADKKFHEKIVKKLLKKSDFKKIPYESGSTNIKSRDSESTEDCINFLSDFFSKLTVNESVKNPSQSQKLSEEELTADLKSVALDFNSESSAVNESVENPLQSQKSSEEKLTDLKSVVLDSNSKSSDSYEKEIPVPDKSDSSFVLKQSDEHSEPSIVKSKAEVSGSPVLDKITVITSPEIEKTIVQSESENCGIQTTFSKKEPSSYEKLEKFYGVSLPLAVSLESSEPLVYRDKKDALNAIKVYKGARFKEFTNRKDAEDFAKQSADLVIESPAPTKKNHEIASPESSSLFRKPTSQQTVEVRKAIEKGDLTKFISSVWHNPMYLISSADSPTIMQEGSRYNALHVAAKFNQPRICREILNIVENPEFFQKLYPEDSVTVRERRIQHITDLYLNSVDKALLETPLHLASKFGFLQVVKVLLSHPLCDKNKRNKFGSLPEELICTRRSGDCSELNQKIKDAFEGEYYIPVLRNDTNVVQPIIGKPCTIEKVKQTKTSFISNPDIHDPEYTVKAYAGPMSPSAAKTFYHIWKHPTSPISFSCSPELLKSANEIRFTDMEKGLERVGRKLAFNMNVDWEEWWPALGAWVNLTTTEGLDMLESYLKQSSDLLKNVDTLNLVDDDCLTPPSSPDSLYDENLNYFTPPSSPELSDEDDNESLHFTKDDIDMFRAIEHIEIDSIKYPQIHKWKNEVLKNIDVLNTPLCNKKNLCTSPVSSFSARDIFKENVRRPLF